MGDNKGELENLNNKLMFSNKYLLKLLWPLFVEQLLLFAVGLIDSVMVASVGESAVSAVSLIDSIMILIIMIMTALATGGAVVVGQYLGQKKDEEARAAGDQLTLFLILLSVSVTAIMYIVKRPLMMVVFGDIEADVEHDCDIYYMIVMASVPFIAVYNGGAALFRSTGNSNISMKISVLMNGINVAGNAILIYGFDRGVEGAAIPTLVSRMVAAIVVYVLLRNPKLRIHLSRKFVCKPQWATIKKILRIGIPNGIENSMFQLGKLILLSMISSFGTASIAANAVGNAVSMIAILPGMAVGYGMIAVISQCVGAGDYYQVKYYTVKLIRWVYFSMFISNVLMIVGVPYVVKLYGLSDETAKLATILILINSISAIFIWPLSFSIPHMLRAASDVTFTMIVSVASMWIFRIFFGIILGKYVGMGVVGVWIAMVIDWAVRSVAFVIRYKSGKWKHPAII